ncbi:MAG: Uma2 family endonuclease [Tychonema bourrellyi B0820]|uniref:Uma2 family endonuclease n=1 Tax=Tychonema bourrellyi FEM_GT703 TaxID=2040638 RepID=A0A2G4F0I6_9CYAN|nr:Uma2 family endonuclease [Tychonema bourrellyi]MDQ2096993.1 Uma2 family endonuclease [Tychonema bourrellyi B0820]PHX55272.1 Uma2 family endonuclease [Tychonema bourrellyi FEM_GT703]
MVTTTSTPVEQQVTPENRVVLKGVSWSTFKALVADVGDDRAWRIAYDRGVLEIRMPLLEHEVPKGLIESFIEATADELEIEVMKAGSLTLEREDLTRAVEPDSCFYIQNEASVRGKRNINLPEDLPPDLAIESDYTNSSVNKDAIYAAIGVPELWRYQRQSLQVYHLVEGKYQKCDRSLAFPFLPVAEIPGFIEQSRTIGQRSAVRLFRQRIREILLSQS